MIKIIPDKEGKLTQWDLDRKVIVTGYDGVAEVHFASPGDDHGAYVVKLVNGQAEIPNILLTMAGTINVYVYPADRTVFATTLWVMAREKPDDYVYTETEVLSYKTLDEKIGDLAKLTTTARENLVAAINEAATKGMASIYMRVAEGYIEYSGDGVTWEKLIAVAELKGDKGDKGDPGSDATVDIVTPTAESTDTQAASAKAVWNMLGTGGSGTDISLGVTSATVGDIVKVKAVDASGKPTAWEAADMASREDWRRIRGEIFDGSNTSLLEISTDEDGNAICLKKVFFVFAAPNISYGSMAVMAKYASGQNLLFSSLSYSDHKNADCPVVGFIDATTPYFTGYIAKTSGYFNQNTYGFLGGARNPKVVSENITSISIGVGINGTHSLGADCTYEIWGVDA